MEKKAANMPSIVPISKYGHLSLGGLAAKESACNAEDLGLIPGWEDLEKGMVTRFSSMACRIPWTAWVSKRHN